MRCYSVNVVSSLRKYTQLSCVMSESEIMQRNGYFLKFKCCSREITFPASFIIVQLMILFFTSPFLKKYKIIPVRKHYGIEAYRRN
jgi:hypothetical protein